jgi:hypothetical protein
VRQPRFYVGEVHGFAIRTDGRDTVRPSGATRIPVTYTVHDRAYAHRTIKEFPPGIMRGTYKLATRKRRAYELAAELNTRHEAWMAQDPERRSFVV